MKQKKDIISGAVCLILLALSSQNVYSQYNDTLNLVFDSLSAKRVTGSVVRIDLERELLRDQRTGLASAINGKVPGVLEAFNTWGTGRAVVLVDGIPQDEYYYNSLNLMEIESILLLKDAASKALYGAQGDKGIVLVTTKRNTQEGRKLRVMGEYRVAVPRAMPSYLSAADYMEKYNQALLNDGIDPASLIYTREAIDATRSGKQRALYPDNDFYSETFLRDYTSDVKVFADVNGGNQRTHYYVNTEWSRNSGWLNTPQGEVTNRLNFRGNLDFAINDYLKLGLNTTARLSFNDRPKAGNYWERFASILPNSYPVFWDPDLISDKELRQMILSEASLTDGQILGGNSSFLDNVYGDLTQNGNTRLMKRNLQFGGRMDLDMSFIGKGLRASAYGGMNFYNTLFSQQNPSYSVYEPVFNPVSGAVDSVYVHGTDKTARQFHTSEENSDFFRQVSYYGTLNYDRTFGDHAISAVGLVYGNEITVNDTLQKHALFHTGISANYVYAGKYVGEVTLTGIGSRKLAKGSRMELAPAFGLAWILSEERFMAGISAIDYLKLRSSFGISKNDNWDNYFLYKGTFVRGATLNYYNGTNRNAETNYGSIANDIGLQKRRDFTVGIEGAFFNKALWLNAGYFSSTSMDNVTLMSETYPQLLGYQDLVYRNFNSDQTRGLELELRYTYKTSRLTVTAGSNLLWFSPKISKREEPVYEGNDRALNRTGNPTDAIWGLLADGLYGEADFNPDGSLKDELPVPAFGAVQAGDIKYLDRNGDHVVDQRDQRIIGHGLRAQYSLYVDIRYGNFGLYVLGIGKAGGSNVRSGNYYRVFGNVKYSEMANYAYGPENKDVKAIHPRLTAGSASHNDRNSDYWVYKNNTFTIPAIQLTYHFTGGHLLPFMKDTRFYLRADNALVFGKNKQFSEVNPDTEPITKGYALGLIASF